MLSACGLRKVHALICTKKSGVFVLSIMHAHGLGSIYLRLSRWYAHLYHNQNISDLKHSQISLKE